LIGFDFVLVFIANGRIVRDDVALAKYAVKNGMKMAFVHSRCDETLRNEFEDYKCDTDEKRQAQKEIFIRRSIYHKQIF
jgi:hypothetical protein